MAKQTREHDPVARIYTAIDDAKVVVRELHEATADLRALIKEARRATGEDVEKAVSDAIDENLRAQVTKLGETVESTMSEMIDKIQTNFREYANRCMYGNPQGIGPNIFEEMRGAAERAMQEHRTVTQGRTD